MSHQERNLLNQKPSMKINTVQLLKVTLFDCFNATGPGTTPVLNLDDVDEILNTVSSTGQSVEEVINSSLVEHQGSADNAEGEGRREDLHDVEVAADSTNHKVSLSATSNTADVDKVSGIGVQYLCFAVLFGA